MKKHRTVPVFVPHEGCPNQCLFCDQRAITRTERFDPDAVAPMLEKAFSKADNRGAQIAFFGGSFTAIDRELMIRLLDVAEDFVRRGLCDSIRLSTRPDAVDGEIMGILRRYSVAAVELGIQSLSEKVLRASERGHGARCCYEAAERIRDEGLELVGQMMLGLPQASPEEEMFTAGEICRMGAAGARVYPTAVFRGTGLALRTEKGEYQPLTRREAVDRGARVCRIFLQRGVRLLRVGLCDNAALHSEAVLGGGDLPAYGEQVYSRIMLEGLTKEFTPIREEFVGKQLLLYAAPGEISRLAGYRKENKRALLSLFSPADIRFGEKEGLAPFEVYYELGEDAHRKKGFLNVLKDT